MQSDLFERLPARRRDPESSKRAARELAESGALSSQQAQAIAAVRAWPGRTSQELAEAAGMDRYMLARRLPECESRAGGVRRGELRKCSVTGRLAMTWWPT